MLRAVLPLFLVLSLACTLGDKPADDDDEGEDVFADVGDDDEEEGDDAGECEDGADNDRDGSFDCDDADCAGSPACEDTEPDTGGDDTGEPNPWQIESYSGDCADGACVYTVTTSRAAAWLLLTVAETADTTSPEPWTERHDGFTLLSTGSDGTKTYALTLDWVADFTEQEANASTLLNEETMGPRWYDRITWMFEAGSAAGERDCEVTGQDPGYFSTDCP